MGTGLNRFTRAAAAMAMAGGLAGGAAGAIAEEMQTPWIKFVVPIEVQNDWNFRSEDPANKHNQIYATIEPEVTIGLWRGLSFYAQAVYEPTTDPDAGEDRLFKDQGLYLQTILLQYEGSLYKAETRSVGFRVWGGKFGPAFGIAWDEAPGIFGSNFAEDYEFTERIGFGVSTTLEDGALGKHTLSFSSFFADTSVLSESLFRNRGRLRLSDGGPSNTGRLNSFVVGLSGEKPFGFQGLSYHASFVSQAVTGADAERGVALALKYEWKNGDLTITPLIEFANFWNYEGDPDVARWYLTTSVLFEYKKWNFSVSNTIRTTRVKNGGGIGRDNLFTVSAGYEFDFGVGVNLAYRLQNEESQATHTFGVLLTYEFEFAFGRKKAQ